MSHRVAVVVGLVLALMLIGPTAASAQAGGPMLDGRRISVANAADLACHDLDLPVIKCFRATDLMLRDVAKRMSVSPRAATVASTGYVVVYADIQFGGASRMLSSDYPNLGTIGWNDRISSFKSFLAEGEFREHTPPGGFTYSYSTSTQVSSLSATYNDKFSSFQID